MARHRHAKWIAGRHNLNRRPCRNGSHSKSAMVVAIELPAGHGRGARNAQMDWRSTSFELEMSTVKLAGAGLAPALQARPPHQPADLRPANLTPACRARTRGVCIGVISVDFRRASAASGYPQQLTFERMVTFAGMDRKATL